jgi:hypothetical protein
VDFSPDGKTLAVGQVMEIMFTPDGKTMITYGEEKKLKFWALERNP